MMMMWLRMRMMMWADVHFTTCPVPGPRFFSFHTSASQPRMGVWSDGIITIKQRPLPEACDVAVDVRAYVVGLMPFRHHEGNPMQFP